MQLSGFPGEFQQMCTLEPIPTLLKLFQNTEEEGTFPKSFYEATITTVVKLKKPQKIKLQVKILVKYTCKNP